MNQPLEEQQKCTKQNKAVNWFTRKKRAVVIVIFALIAVLVVPVLAWLYYQRTMQTITKINMPYALRIGAGNARPIQQLELSNIDVSGGEGSTDVVFCVYSVNETKTYHLQLAHTTNIGFTYEIYSATKMSEGEDTKYYLGDYYKEGEKVKGSYLNQNSGNIKLANDVYHETTYGTYNNVQANAEPLYWKTNIPQTLILDKSNNYYINYYILRIRWDDTVQNDKETDMVYLMAEVASSGDAQTETGS